MKSLRFLDRRVGYSLGAIGLLLGMVVPAAFPTFASADSQITSRSITLGSSNINATTSYDLKYTSQAAIDSGGLIEVDFCDNPIIGSTCGTSNMPSTASVSLGAVKFDGADTSASASVSATNTNKGLAFTVGTTGYASGKSIDITFNNIVNPASTGTVYARVVTYTSANKASYVDPTHLGTTDSESGSVALAYNNQIGVTAYVKEALTFCVYGALNGSAVDTPPTAGCTNASGTGPSMTLGEPQGDGTTALDTGHVSTAKDYAQISTNAAHGAIVNLQSDSTSCGGLYRDATNKSTTCGIGPQATSGNTISIGNALFGLTVGSQVAATGGTADGTFQKAQGSNYDSTKYFMDYAAGNTTGVTSPYGSPLLDTNSTEVQNQNVPITFGASTSNSTPAGIYRANLNMIATGTF
jgi:hypothetical protein